MRIQTPHSWGLAPRQAAALQKELASRLILKDDFEDLRVIAGADLALDDGKRVGFAGIVLFEYPSLKEIKWVSAQAPLTFPYIPGLLSFREGPILLKAFEQLDLLPDLILFDGQGIAHPRRFGIACHMGLLLGRPTIGCAKSRLCGEYKEPGLKKGNWSPLTDKGGTIGAVLRTRDQVKPVFVSPGHRITLKTAVEIVLQCCDRFRIPKPTREADRFVGSIKSQRRS
jgi:deoxyribonuclease V